MRYTAPVIYEWDPSSFLAANAQGVLGSSAHGKQHAGSVRSMKKGSAKKMRDDLRPEYDLTQLKGGVRGKYYRQATAGTNLVLIEPELASVFPDAEAVNRALRALVDTAAAVAHPHRRGRTTAATRRAKGSARVMPGR